MSAPAETGTCANCGREVAAAGLDPAGWCAACRREVVRRATLVARVIGGAGGLFVGLWVVLVVQPEARSVVVWLLLVAAVYFLLYTLTRRVAFEVIQTRGVRPPQGE